MPLKRRWCELNGVTLEQLGEFITLAATIAAPVISVVAYFNQKVLGRLSSLERWNANQQKDINSCMDEQRILLRAVLSCLKNMQEQGCGRSLDSSIDEIEAYAINMAHCGKSRKS